MSKIKIVLIATEGLTTSLLYNSLPTDAEKTIFLEGAESKGAILKRRMKRIGFFKTSGQVLFMLFVLPFIPARKKRMQELIQEARLSTKKIPAQAIHKISSVRNPELIDQVSALHPDLVIINGTRILPASLLSSISAPIVNIHVGITPQYRGVHGGFWALKEGNPSLYGVTLHYVDKGIDTGRIIAQKILVPTKIDNFKTYPIQQYIGGIELLHEHLEKILAHENFNPPPLTKTSKLHYHPTLLEYLLG